MKLRNFGFGAASLMMVFGLYECEVHATPNVPPSISVPGGDYAEKTEAKTEGYETRNFAEAGNPR